MIVVYILIILLAILGYIFLGWIYMLTTGYDIATDLDDKYFDYLCWKYPDKFFINKSGYKMRWRDEEKTMADGDIYEYKPFNRMSNFNNIVLFIFWPICWICTSLKFIWDYVVLNF